MTAKQVQIENRLCRIYGTDDSGTDSSDIGMKSIVQIFIVAILQKLPICCMGINYTFKLKIGSLLYSTATEALRYSIHNIYH